MKIKFDRTKEQLELVQAMASKDRAKAYEAQAAMAKFVGPVLGEVINTAPTLSNIFQPLSFNLEDGASIPLDLYSDITDEDYIKVYSQTMPGGLASNSIVPSTSELKVATYTMDSAYNFDRKYAAKSRLDVVAKTFARLGQEILLKQERTSANLILGTLADNASSNLVAGTSTSLLPADFNNLVVKAQRVNTSWTSGTPVGRVGGVTDLWLSPERMADLRKMAYNPINTVANDQTVAAGEDSGITAPDSVRAALFNGAGLANFYGFALHQINELGKSQRYTQIFDAQYSGTFTAASDDLILGIDMSRESLFKVLGTDTESNSSIVLEVDDQFVARQRRIGYYLQIEEGRVILDKRVIFGLRIANAAS